MTLFTTRHRQQLRRAASLESDGLVKTATTQDRVGFEWFRTLPDLCNEVAVQAGGGC